MKRREFLGLAAATGAGLLLGANLDSLHELYRENNIEVKTFLNNVFTRRDKRKNAIVVVSDDEWEDNALLVNHLLSSRGYHINNLIFPDVNRENIFGAIADIADKSENVSDMETFFYYHGHGFSYAPVGKGIRISHKPRINYNEDIFDYELIQEMGKIKGKKAIVLDSCFSGHFVEEVRYCSHLGSIRDYVLLAACPAGKKTIASETYMRGRDVGAFTFGFYNLIKDARRPIDLSSVNILSGSKLHRDHPEKIIMPLEVLPTISFDVQRAFDTSYFL